MVLPSRLGIPISQFPVYFSLNFESIPTFFHSRYITWPSYSYRFIHSVYIKWTVQIMMFLIMKPPPLPILMPLGPKYSHQDPVFKYWFLFNGEIVQGMYGLAVSVFRCPFPMFCSVLTSEDSLNSADYKSVEGPRLYLISYTWSIETSKNPKKDEIQLVNSHGGC